MTDSKEQNGVDDKLIEAIIETAVSNAKNPNSALKTALETLRDIEMSKKQLGLHLLKICQRAEIAFLDKVSDSSIALIAIGESEYSRASSRKFLSDLIPKAAEAGITCLALEWKIDDQNLLDEFCRTGDLQALQNKCKHYDRHFDWCIETSKSEPDPYYYDILAQAHKYNMRLIAVDEAKSGNQPYKGRDEHMANQLILEIKRGNRVLFFGGSKHHYRREKDRTGKFKNAIEIVADEMGADRIWSFLALIQRDSKNNYFQLARCFEYLNEPLAIPSSDILIKDKIACVEGRCAYGTCEQTSTFDGAYRDCLQCSRHPDLRPGDGMYPVKYSAWDKVILFPEQDPLPWK